MGNLGQNMCGGETVNRVVFDAPHQIGARRAESRMGSQMVHENVRVQENRGAGREVAERHALSWGSNSGSMAMRSRAATSPVHLIIPAVRSAQPSSGSIVTRTFSWSL